MRHIPGTRYIRKRGSSYEVRLPEHVLADSTNLGSFPTLEDAQAARDQALASWEAEQRRRRPQVEGYTNEDGAPDPDELWAQAIRTQVQVEANARKRARQTITIPDPERPFALAYLSDLHLGDPGVDYKAIRTDAELIRDTPRLWCGYHGDGLNNWVIGKLQRLQRGEVLTLDGEIALFANWLDMVAPSLLWVVTGNHDNWTRTLAGIDLVRSLLQGVRVLYDRFEVCFTLVWGDHQLRYKVRHAWRYRSVFNATHPIEVGWQRGGTDFDVGVGGHTHTGTVCRPFWRHGRELYAVLTGTYKTIETGESYGRSLAYAPPMHRGCGAHVFWGDRMIFCHDLEMAAAVLAALT